MYGFHKMDYYLFRGSYLRVYHSHGLLKLFGILDSSFSNIWTFSAIIYLTSLTSLSGNLITCMLNCLILFHMSNIILDISILVFAVGFSSYILNLC